MYLWWLSSTRSVCKLWTVPLEQWPALWFERAGFSTFRPSYLPPSFLPPTPLPYLSSFAAPSPPPPIFLPARLFFPCLCCNTCNDYNDSGARQEPFVGSAPACCLILAKQSLTGSVSPTFQISTPHRLAFSFWISKFQLLHGSCAVLSLPLCICTLMTSVIPTSLYDFYEVILITHYNYFSWSVFIATHSSFSIIIENTNLGLYMYSIRSTCLCSTCTV